jgi:DNA mismatch repair ATPase MutS
VTLGPPYGLLVTGANMAGKSTFIRTVGVTTILAQTIHTCLATRYSSPVLFVSSALRVDDDLLTGRSYYLVEVETLVARVKAASSSSPHLFLLDELFRGTNAVERIAAAEAVLVALAGPPAGAARHRVLAATHDGELVSLLRGLYDTSHFADALSADGLVFDYHLRPGPTSTRNAIALLRLEGAPDTLIERALARAAALDRARAAADHAG